MYTVRVCFLFAILCFLIALLGCDGEASRSYRTFSMECIQKGGQVAEVTGPNIVCAKLDIIDRWEK